MAEVTTQMDSSGGARRIFAPIAGLASDLDNLLTEFKRSNSVRYEQFITCWNNARFSLIFAGRQNDRECREFTEECLAMVIAYCQPHLPINVRIFGLYLMYGIYFLHPYEPKPKIRVTLSDWQILLALFNQISADQHLDAAYIFTHLRYERAFHFVSSRIQQNPQMRCATDSSSETQQQKIELLREKCSQMTSIFAIDTIDELSVIHDQYHHFKCKLAGQNATKPDPSLDVVDSGLVQYITKNVTLHEDWRKNKAGLKSGIKRSKADGHATTDSEAESELEQSSGFGTPERNSSPSGRAQGDHRAAIRARAFSTTSVAITSRRHRQAILSSETNSGAVVSPSPAAASPRKGKKKMLKSKAATSDDDQVIVSKKGKCSETMSGKSSKNDDDMTRKEENGPSSMSEVLSMPELVPNVTPRSSSKQTNKTGKRSTSPSKPIANVSMNKSKKKPHELELGTGEWEDVPDRVEQQSRPVSKNEANQSKGRRKKSVVEDEHQEVKGRNFSSGKVVASEMAVGSREENLTVGSTNEDNAKIVETEKKSTSHKKKDSTPKKPAIKEVQARNSKNVDNGEAENDLFPIKEATKIKLEQVAPKTRGRVKRTDCTEQIEYSPRRSGRLLQQ